MTAIPSAPHQPPLNSREATAPALADIDDRDLFALGRRAAEAAAAITGGKGIIARSRQLQSNGQWRGPRDAAESYVEQSDLIDIGGLATAQAVGARTLIASNVAGVREGSLAGMRVVCRVPFRAGEPGSARTLRLRLLAELVSEGVHIDGVLPTAEQEPMGLDTLHFFAMCRLELTVPHVLADFEKLGHRLAQMALGFGANELFGPILPERALRLGGNAHNPVLTRKEAAILLRGAGLVPCERLSSGALEEITS
jgi:hypothetical protein